jgi:hypothetical protein
MEVLRRYRCDHGHEWRVVVHEGDPEFPEHTRCPEGHEAVTCVEERPADEVQILIRPAARIVDSVTGQLADDGKYRFILLDRDGGTVEQSSNLYTWEEAVALGRLFRGKTVERAREWWGKRRP